MDQHGADAVRWFMAAVGSPWSARRVGHNTLQEVVRKTLLTYWNTVAFQSLYGRTAGWSPSDADPAPADRPVLDRWVLSELNALVRRRRRGDGRVRHPRGRQAARPRSSTTCPTGTSAAAAAGSGAATRRPWPPCTRRCRTVTLLMAPITPFITERVWQDLVVPVDARCPVVGAPGRATRSADERAGRPGAVRADGRWSAAWSSSAARARADSGMKTRQPLSRALASAPGFDEARRGPARGDRRRAERRLGAPASPRPADRWWTRRPRRTSGRSASASARRCSRSPRRSRPRTPRRSATALRRTGAATVTVDGEPVHPAARTRSSSPRRPREGWAVAADAGATLALDLHLTPELRRAGVARDAIRQIQEARKTSGLEVSDRIVLRYEATDRRDRGGAGRARRPGRRRGAGHRLRRRATGLGRRRAVHRRGARPDLLAPEGLMPEGMARHRA